MQERVHLKTLTSIQNHHLIFQAELLLPCSKQRAKNQEPRTAMQPMKSDSKKRWGSDPSKSPHYGERPDRAYPPHAEITTEIKSNPPLHRGRAAGQPSPGTDVEFHTRKGASGAGHRQSQGRPSSPGRKPQPFPPGVKPRHKADLQPTKHPANGPCFPGAEPGGTLSHRAPRESPCQLWEQRT